MRLAGLAEVVATVSIFLTVGFSTFDKPTVKEKAVDGAQRSEVRDGPPQYGLAG